MAKQFNERFILQLLLGVMFLTLGILGLSNYNSDLAQVGRALGRMFGSSSGNLNVVISVIEVAAGIFLLVDLFSVIPSGIVSILHLVVFILFAANMVLRFVINGFLEPDLLPWLASVSKEAVILTSIWMIRKTG
jgi:uncharacterized membrane protein YphA (DoxX/SURF4 family)